ncbi:MAG: HDOD domain-containing protein [Desulforhopalus sp.]
MYTSKSISIEKQLESLPPLPITVTKVMQVTNNPESSANDLLKAILPDQTMCIAILKIANSVLYGRPKRVSSLETAIMVLGFNEIQNIVLAKAAVTAFKPTSAAHGRTISVFWDHAFTCGLAARIIGEHINQPSGQFFIAGLLHDIGKLAMLLAFGENYNTSKWLYGLSTNQKLEQEKQAFSITHDIVGSRLLQRWQFPDNLITALHYHHTPQRSSKMRGYPLVIQLADFLAFMYCRPGNQDEKTLKTSLHKHLPSFEDQWHKQNLPWEDITLEALYAWLKVDMGNGSGILDILAS